jgi:DNA-3-methyladenine glycosylase
LRIGKEFFDRDTNEVAQSLIGKKLIRYIDFHGNYYKLSGMIVESEAYRQLDDPASHAYKKKTERNKAMFGDSGHVYIYRIYGNHYCFNLVAKDKDKSMAGAVLIRSIQPLEGISLMKLLRKNNNILKLTSGPGRLTQAFKISIKHNNLSVTDNSNEYLYVEEDNKIKQLISFKVKSMYRIGISKGIEKKWRYIMMNLVESKNFSGYICNPFVSKM